MTSAMTMTIMAAAAVFGQTAPVGLEKLSSGLEFRPPAGWQVKSNDQAAVLLPPNMVMDGNEPAELYIVAMLAGVKDLQDPNLLAILQGKFIPAETRFRSTGAPRGFQTAGGPGFVHSYEFVANGMTGALQLYVTGLPAGGVAAALALGRKDLVAQRAPAMLTVATSLSHQAGGMKVESGSAAVRQWIQRLSNKKLMQFSGYSSGTSGGYNGQKVLALAADGSYAFRESGVVSISAGVYSSSSVKDIRDDGKWRVYQQGAAVMIELRSSKGDVDVFPLGTQGNKVTVGNQAYLVGNWND
jgi:hypothetical protein